MEDLLERFNGLKALVVGDVMIDVYSKGVVERMSPEAPVPIVSVKTRFERLGGAANVALNLKALGAMQKTGLDNGHFVFSRTRPTTVKHRIFNGERQVLRMDEESTANLNNEEHQGLLDVIETTLEKNRFDVIILQDYNKGVLTKKMIQSIIAFAQKAGIPVAVDPKKKNFFAYQGVTLFKPNAKELREGLGVTAETPEELQAAMLRLQERIGCRYLMVTLSDKGVMMLRDGTFLHLPAHPRNIVDVSGAGDTVLSVAALCVALQDNAETIASLSNLAGGLVCEAVGVVPINKERLSKEVRRIRHE